MAEQQWFVGGIERGSNRLFIVPVEKRDAATLLPIIQKHIMSGTTVISDLWKSYFRIDELPESYRHLTVNHSVNFVDPVTGACTHNIESAWQKFKHRHKKEYGTARTLLCEYLSQHLWGKMFAGEDSLCHLWSQIAKKYPINQHNT